jgi:hypothetical protein
VVIRVYDGELQYVCNVQMDTNGVKVETGHQLVYFFKSFLDFNDDKVGKKLRRDCPIYLSYVYYLLFEIKTSHRIENVFGPSESKAVLKLIAARCTPNQLNAFVNLADVTTGVGRSFKFDCDIGLKYFDMHCCYRKWEDLCYPFWGKKCVSDATRVDSCDPKHMQPIEFKRRRLSAPNLHSEWEQFIDAMEDPDSTEIERRLITPTTLSFIETY